MLGPGPSPVPQRVLRALGAPTIGHLDPQYIAIMDETCEFLRQVFRTKNPLTFPVSGTGMAGMECVACNLIEPGDEVIVCINGVFGTRMKDVMERCGAKVHAVEATWGDIFAPEQIAAALKQHPGTKLVGIVHAETSTGALQPLTGLADIVHAHGALLAVDMVTSLGGHEVRQSPARERALILGLEFARAVGATSSMPQRRDLRLDGGQRQRPVFLRARREERVCAHTRPLPPA